MATISLSQNPELLQELLKRAIAGDGNAFGQIYDLYFPKLYRFIFYRVNHRESAEDLVSETFVRAWNRLKEIEKVASFNGWLYQIARNLVIDYYRARRPTASLDDLENILEYERNVVDEANLSIEQKLLLKMLEELPPDHRLVIKLKFLDELETDEIAEILNKSEGAIRVIQHRAIEKLKILSQNSETGKTA